MAYFDPYTWTVQRLWSSHCFRQILFHTATTVAETKWHILEWLVSFKCASWVVPLNCIVTVWLALRITVLLQSSEGSETLVTNYLIAFQYSQCTYNVTLTHYCVIIVAVEKQWVLHIPSVCSLSYPAREAHATYCIVVCGLSDCTISFYVIS